MSVPDNPEIALLNAVVDAVTAPGVGPKWGLTIVEAVAAAAPHIVRLAESDPAAVDRALSYLVLRGRAEQDRADKSSLAENDPV